MNPVGILLLLWLQAATSLPPGAELPAYADSIIVTDTREERRLEDAVSQVTSLSRKERAASPAVTLDEQLRQVPGFSLLRRSSSLSAHPTTQGVSLRGLGPSGASRTLVLFDGTPLNDPFGGWVYWNRFPSGSLETVEIARGSLSQLYGSAAMGGVIQLLPRTPKRGTFEANLRGGDHGTQDAEVFVADASSSGDRMWSLAGRHYPARKLGPAFLHGPTPVERPLVGRELAGHPVILCSIEPVPASDNHTGRLARTKRKKCLS